MAISAYNGIARILKAEGVPWVSTYPVCVVNNALGEEGVPIVMMRDDRYAAALADAFTRVTSGSQIGVCTIMGGINAAGLQLAYGAFAQAYLDGSRVLCITDGVPADAAAMCPYDIGESLRSVTKWVGHIHDPAQTVPVMRRAFTLLRTGRPGPVVVTIPRYRGEAARAFSYDEEEHPWIPVKGWKSAPDPQDVKHAVKVLLGAKKPLIYAGEGVLYANATGELKEFAELLQAPVLATLKAKSVFPENHPLSIGVRGGPASHFLTECDVMLAIGNSLSRNHFRHTVPGFEQKTIIHCVTDETDVNRCFKADYAIIGDAKFALQTAIEEAKAQGNGHGNSKEEFLAEIKDQKDRFRSEYAPLLISDETPINPYRVYGDLQKTLDPYNSFVTHESGNTRDQLSTIYETIIPRGFAGWGNVSTLGFCLPLAMAAKLAYPARQCVAVTGDAGISYILGNMETLVRYQIGVTFIHINNGGFAGYGPGFWGPGHDPYTYEVLDHTRIDMAGAVGNMGYYSERVTDPQEVVPALERALDENSKGQPAYLEMICSQHPVYPAFVGR